MKTSATKKSSHHPCTLTADEVKEIKRTFAARTGAEHGAIQAFLRRAVQLALAELRGEAPPTPTAVGYADSVNPGIHEKLENVLTSGVKRAVRAVVANIDLFAETVEYLRDDKK